jgi:hypothetical protein
MGSGVFREEGNSGTFDPSPSYLLLPPNLLACCCRCPKLPVSYLRASRSPPYGPSSSRCHRPPAPQLRPGLCCPPPPDMRVASRPLSSTTGSRMRVYPSTMAESRLDLSTGSLPSPSPLPHHPGALPCSFMRPSWTTHRRPSTHGPAQTTSPSPCIASTPRPPPKTHVPFIAPSPSATTPSTSHYRSTLCTWFVRSRGGRRSGMENWCGCSSAVATKLLPEHT